MLKIDPAWRRVHGAPRRGHIIVLTALFLILMLGMVAFAIDIGHLLMARTELQRAADAAALAAAWQLVGEGTPEADPIRTVLQARSSAYDFAAANSVCGSPLLVDPADVQVGRLLDHEDPAGELSFANASEANAVEVRVVRSNALNGEVPFFFAPVFARHSASSLAVARSVVWDNFSGFQIPKSGKNLPILPIALSEELWESIGEGADNWTWDSAQAEVVPGADGKFEINLYPQRIGAGGNSGTVRIGRSNNGTGELSRQIEHGIDSADLADFGGKLEFDVTGEMNLGGDPGISNGIKNELQAIVGQPRMIPIYRAVSGSGSNASYSIVKFVGVRIVEVQMTGNPKRVIIQPASVVVQGGIPTSDPERRTNYIFAPAKLVQ